MGKKTSTGRTNKKPAWLAAGCFAAGVILLLLASGGIYLLTRPQSYENLIPAFSSPVQVRMVSPRVPDSFPADSFIPVNATARSDKNIVEMELWINGQLEESQRAENTFTTMMLASWNWQPGRPGTFLVQVRAVDTNGRTGISNPVVLDITPPAGARQLIACQAGDTLATLAEKYGTTPEKILQSNPELGAPILPIPGEGSESPAEPTDFNAPLSPGLILFITLDPTLPGIPSGSPEQPADDPPDIPLPDDTAPDDPQGPPLSSGDPLLWQTLFFQLKKVVFPASDLPLAPTLERAKGLPDDPCIANIRVWRNSKNEDGYFVYRWTEAAAFPQRIANLSAPLPADPTTFYREENPVSGNLTYMVSAYNTAGESFSAPLTYDMTACNYSPIESRYVSEETTTGGIGLDKGYLTVPSSVDLAYLYVGINNSHWERVPPGSNNFLSGSGYTFNLNDYLGNLVEAIPDPDLDVTIEVWGWQGAHVGLIGTYHAKVHRSVLQICSQQGENRCQGVGGSASWANEVFLSDTVPVEDQSFDLHLALSSVMDIAGRKIVVSYHPFNGPGMMDAQGGHGIIGIHHILGTGYPRLALSKYYNDKPVTTGTWTGTEYSANVLKEIFPPGTPFDLYVRVFPLDKEGNVGVPSNTISIHYKTPPKGPEDYPIGSTLPSLFTVEIMEETYQPPSFIHPANWGCVVVQNNASGYHAGQVLCPPGIPSQSGNWDAGAVLSGEADMIASGMSWLSEQFEALKEALVTELAGLIPGCGNSCKAMLKKGLEIGITALTGLPPSIPNFDDLSAQGILYAVDQVQSSLTGYECGEACVSVLKSRLASMVAEARRIESQPGCTAHEDVAKYYGRQAGWCLPSNVLVEPYPGGSNQAGVVFVRVTRNSTPAPPGNYIEWYSLDIATEGINPGRTGTFGKECKYYADGYQPADPVGYYKEAGVINFWQDPYTGQLYRKVRVPMPVLLPGESMLIPIPLQPVGHDYSKDTYMPMVGCDGFAGFKYLFYRGTSRIVAAEFCYVKESDSLVYCGGGGLDTFEVVNPWDPADQW